MKSSTVPVLGLFLAFPSMLSTQSNSAEVAALAICARATRDMLSPVAAEALNAIEANQAARADSTVPFSRILSTCNRFVSVRVDGPSIFAGARDIIALANEEVDIAFYKWDHNSRGSILIGDGLIAAQARRSSADPLYVRIVIDDIDNPIDPTRAINHIYDARKLWESRGLDLSKVRVQLATSPRPLFLSANLHDKIIVVDGRYVLVTGSQPERKSDPITTAYTSGWHDAGFIFEGSAALSALSAFEHTWLGDAIHWDCQPRDLSNDCLKKSTKYPTPPRILPSFGSQSPGNVPLLAVGRDKGGISDNDTNNPQAIAWLAMMDGATSRIDVETPNINDDAFQAALLRALARGLTVRLITSLGFNDQAEDLPFVGGDNLEVVGNLRKQVRASNPAAQTRFQLRWYSHDGIEPILGNESRASHTKYMATDGRIAMVGSGNQDTFAWNVSREFNFLIDDVAATASIDSALFAPDWNRAVNEYLELYDGNNGLEDVVCPIGLNSNKSFQFSDPLLGTQHKCNNDAARSMLLHDVPAGKVVRFYDHGGRQYQDDDWVEIITKRFVARKYINTFQQSFSDADVRVIYHRDNGLDGKVSAAEIAGVPVGAVMDLYDGNNAGGGLVCSNRVTALRTINLTSDAFCNNDAARSMVLYDFPTDKVIFVYDESGGSRSDDWTLIVPKRVITQATIGTFQSSFENLDMRVCHAPDNGLDGKVSRIRIGARSEAIGLCGVTAPSSSGNPFTYASGADQFLACWGIASGAQGNCGGIGDFNDRQMCSAIVTSSQTPCTSMTDRNLQLACYGMSFKVPSNCRDITDANMRNFCYGVSDSDPNLCTPITDRNTQLLCFAMSNGIESNCRDISDPDDRNFCFGVSTPSTTSCSSIQH
jgi:phosphatidylserine/phosphatidylglycerophosphate/cardiolipin synthase-like enzyme